MSVPNLATISFECFCGIDVAYKDFTAATLKPSSDHKPKLAAKPFAQSSQGFEQFIQWLLASKIDPQKHLIVMEATGSYWIALACALHQAGFLLAVINPAQAHYFAKALLKRSKSDGLDAQTLAQLAQALQNRLVSWDPPPQIYHELRQRLTQRDSLSGLKNQVQNQLHALSVNPVVIGSVKAQLQHLISTFNQQIEAMEEEIAGILKTENEWSSSIKLLQTIPGIGLLTASWLVVASLNFTTCQNVEALISYIGLAPREYTSGSSIRGRPSIGHSGHARVRTLLYLATLSAARYNPAIKAFWHKLREEKGKPVKVARCACARKLAHLAYAIAKSGKPFETSRFTQELQKPA